MKTKSVSSTQTPVIDPRAARERADHVLAIQVALRDSCSVGNNELPVQGVHIREFQSLERAIRLLGSDSARTLMTEWERLALAIMRKGSDSRFGAHAVRAETIKLWERVRDEALKLFPELAERKDS